MLTNRQNRVRTIDSFANRPYILGCERHGEILPAVAPQVIKARFRLTGLRSPRERFVGFWAGPTSQRELRLPFLYLTVFSDDRERLCELSPVFPFVESAERSGIYSAAILRHLQICAHTVSNPMTVNEEHDSLPWTVLSDLTKQNCRAQCDVVLWQQVWMARFLLFQRLD